MQRTLAIALLLLFATSVHAAEDCSSELTKLGTLYQLRSLMMKSYTTASDVRRFADARIDDLREPLREGGHRWVRWVRPSSGGPVVKREHNVVAAQGSGTPDRVESNAGRVYAAAVVVPRKRSLLRDNNPVWVGTVEVTYESDGRARTKREDINQWMNPGTSRTIDLREISHRAHATVDAAVSSRHVKQAVVEIHLHQAVAEDDPANPAYDTIRMLQRVREEPEPVTVDAEIAAAERSIFRGADSIPLLTLVDDLRRADELMRSDKTEEQEKGSKLLKETLRRLR